VSNRRCGVWGLACSTGYVKRGCRCADCLEWQSERLARGREGGPRTPRTPTRRAAAPEPAPAPEPLMLRRVPMPSEFGLRLGRQCRAVPAGKAAAGGIFVRLACLHEAPTAPMSSSVPGTMLVCPQCGQTSKVEAVQFGRNTATVRPWPTISTAEAAKRLGYSSVPAPTTRTTKTVLQ
jgi:hypothetical protein